MPSPRRKLSRPFRSGAPAPAPGEAPLPPEVEAGSESTEAASGSPEVVPPAAQAEAMAAQPVAPAIEPAPPPVPPPAAVGGELLDAHEPFLEPATEYELPPEALLEPDGGGDTAFARDLDRSVADFGASRPPARTCEWCNTPLPEPTPASCPNCGAPLTPAEPDLEIPGLTTMSMEAVFARQRAEAQRRGAGASPAPEPAEPSQTGAGSGAAGVQLDETAVQEAVKPPDDEVRRMMLQMEIEQLRSSLKLGGAAEGPPEAGEAPDDQPA